MRLRLILGVVFVIFVAAWPAQAQTDVCQAAKREMAYGQAATEDAKDSAGFLRAAREFEKATKKAPDCPAAYFNLGVVSEKAGRLSAAKSAYERYLKLDPKAPDASSVEQQVFKLEYRIREATAATATRAPVVQKRQKTLGDTLAGGWYQSRFIADLGPPYPKIDRTSPKPTKPQYIGRTSGNKIELSHDGRIFYSLIISGAEVAGTETEYRCRKSTLPIKGTISSDKRTIRLHRQFLLWQCDVGPTAVNQIIELKKFE